MFQNIIQGTCTECIACTCCFDGILLKERSSFYFHIFVVSTASVFSKCDEDKRNVVFLFQKCSAFVIVCSSEQEFYFIIGNFKNITFAKAVFDLCLCVIQRFP